MSKKAVVLLSGGLDSATVLAQAQRDGYTCYTLSFDYGQRHAAELEAARRIAEVNQVEEHRVFSLQLDTISHSSLTDPSCTKPIGHTPPVLQYPQRTPAQHNTTHDYKSSPDSAPKSDIPPTYVPARNTIFLSLAMAWAESLQCDTIYIGVNAVDYSGYPDCRPEFIKAFQVVADLATRDGVEGRGCRIMTPLINLSKAEIIRLGTELGVDYSRTVSCYRADKRGRACGQCDACHFRTRGFCDAGIPDPTPYQ